MILNYKTVFLDKYLSLKNSKLIFGTFIVSVALFVASFFAYLLQVLLGRNLSVEDYGIFNSLLSLSTFFTIPVTAVTTSLIKVVSDQKAKGNDTVITKLFYVTIKASLIAGLILFLQVIIGKNFLANYLNIKDKEIFLFFGLQMLVGFLTIGPSAFLKGFQDFTGFSLVTITNSFFRLSVVFGLVYFGFGLKGAFSGFFIVAVIGFFFGYSILRKRLTVPTTEPLNSVYKSALTIGLSSLFMTLLMNGLNNIDIIVVKHLFSEIDAGLYSSVVTVGKIVVFGASTITVVMFPVLSQAYSSKSNYRSVFAKFLILQIFILLGAVVVFSAFPEFIIKTMFGVQFLPAAQYLPKYTIFSSIYVLINFFLMSLIAMDKSKIIYYLAMFIPVQYIALENFSADLNRVIEINSLVSGVVLLIIIIQFMLILKRSSLHSLRDIRDLVR